MTRSKIPVAAAALVAVISGGVALMSGGDDYRVQILMTSADGTFEGGKVTVGGRTIGKITDVGVLDKKALVTVTIDDDAAPLHAGTNARISWESVVGGRVVELLPGPESNPELPSGEMILSTTERVELDQILTMLDAPTRHKVQNLVHELNKTLGGSETEINRTINTAGPTIEALGEVMRAIGQDGPAIKDLVTRLQMMTKVVAARDADVSATIAHLHRLTSELADSEGGLRQTLAELPETVQAARSTLDAVPGAVDATVPMLHALRPGTQELTETARNLSPVLRALRPTVAALRPTLASAQSLLRSSPALLDGAHSVVPDVTTAFKTLQPAVTFLRPYTPELTGWLTNWTSLFASQTSGNYARLLIPEGATSVVGVHPSLPFGTTRDPRPAPGSLAGQPWVDANGDEVR